MLLLVILSIIPKLPLFLFWNPNFTQISNQKKKTIMELEKNFSTLYALSSSIARNPREESPYR